MSSLEKRIKKLEVDIAHKDAYLHEQMTHFGQEVPPTAALLTIGASLLAGFLIARKKSLATLLKQGTVLFFRAKFWTRKIKRFLPY